MPARVLLLALGAGATFITLQRNDLLGASGRTLFGTPSRETPQGVRAFLASLPPLAPPDSLKPKPLPPRKVEPRPESASQPAAPARPPAASKAAPGAKAKKPAKGKAKSKANPGK